MKVRFCFTATFNYVALKKKKKEKKGVPIVAQQVTDPTRIHEDLGLTPGPSMS